MNYALITVDTEGHDGKNPVDKLILGKLSNGLVVGIDMIMDIADEYDIKALFFVDFAEAWDYGKDKIIGVARHIEGRGHFVGVHIHPDHMADRNRFFLWEYTKVEQYEIIKKCTDLYVEALGHMPLSFRAGRYSANIDTLDIIDELKYKYDFSEYMGQKWCGIVPPITADKPCRYKNLVEFPVTVFKASDTPFLQRFDKLDMEMVKNELSYVVKKYNSLDDNVLSLFLHSFSFANWRRTPNNPSICRKNIKKCKRALDQVTRAKNITLIAENDLKKIIEEHEAEFFVGNREPQVKVTNWILAYYFLFATSFRIFRYNKKARLFICINFMIIAIALVVIFTMVI